MKTELLKDHYLNGTLLAKGTQIEIDDEIAKAWVKAKWAKPTTLAPAETGANEPKKGS